MFSSVLIANRGEIACRIAKTAQRLGLRTIAVYSDADAGALHVRACEEAHRIGPPPARESYLDAAKIIAAATQAGADCLHPGYGFLSENADFAEACAAAGIVFVGPPSAAIRAMGLKDAAKSLMEKAGIPVVPGYHGERQDSKFLKEKAYEIGYPVLIKAIAGGGGRGMRRVDRHADFDAALESAVREARAAFADSRVLVEKYISAPRHIEFQIFADQHGNVIHLNERDCSLQRRHQKVIEEAPAPGIPADLRQVMGGAAVEAAKAVGYVGAGTVEFIVDSARGLRPDGFWFMEMNTRLQVEHPVTEAITGLDLVEWQFRVAAGEPLPMTQNEVAFRGHAVEARVYAEDPAHGFAPSTGRLVLLDLPDGEGIRVDTGVAAGSEVTAFYDPMIAKVIAHAPSREETIGRLASALERARVAGPRTNVAFLAALCRAPEFRGGTFDTGFIDANLDSLIATQRTPNPSAIAAGARALLERQQAHIAARSKLMSNEEASPWSVSDGFRLSGDRSTVFPVQADGEVVAVKLRASEAGPRVEFEGAEPASDAALVDAGSAVFVIRSGRQTVVQPLDFSAVDLEQTEGEAVLRAPMHGKVIEILVDVAEAVEKGQKVAAIEAMKMEHQLRAPIAGVVAEVAAKAGSQVADGAKILVIRPA